MNEITTTTAPELSLEQCDELLVQGICNIRDAVLGYTLHGLTQAQISERVKGLGLKGSVRTIGRHVADLRAEGLLPAVGEKPRSAEYKKRYNPETVKMADSVPTTQPEPTSNVLPHHPAPTPQQHCVSTDESSTVIYPDVLPAVSDGQSDYDRAIQLFDELFRLSKANFANGWTELQWNELGGRCRTLSECCDARGKRKRPVSQQQVQRIGAN